MSVITALHNQAEALLGVRIFHLLRYLISGGTAAATHVSVLYLLVQFANFHYLAASIAAYVAGIVVSFTLHKFWTFGDKPTHDMHLQFGRYLTIVVLNLVLNTSLMYLFVTQLSVWYLYAQIITTAIIAITGYLGYKYFVFVKRPVLENETR